MGIKGNGDLLASTLRATFGQRPVQVLAHSMGGLVARSAMVHHGANIGGVITLGTPHHGTVIAEGIGAVVDKSACIFATDAQGALDLRWDSFNNPSLGCTNEFLCGPSGLNTVDQNQSKYITYAGELGNNPLACSNPIGIVTNFLDSLLLCNQGLILTTLSPVIGFGNDGIVPKQSASFAEYDNSALSNFFMRDNIQLRRSPRVFSGIQHISIHDSHLIFHGDKDNHPNYATPNVAQDLLDFYDSLTPPAVNTTGITNGATGIAANSAISVTFSEALDVSTVNTSTFTLSGPGGLVVGTVTYNATTNTATFTPSAALAYNTTYTATITTGVKDLASNPLASNYSWSFTTTSGPVGSPITPSVKTSIAGGGEFTLAIKNDGTVWAWGNNTYGQLGDGTTTNRSTPVQVSGLTGVTSIAGGGATSPANEGHSIALKSDGTVWAWGRNIEGQLGDGSFTNRYTPIQVSGLAGVTAIKGGAAHTLALKNDGTVWAWGSNVYGQLGDGAASGARVNRSIPFQVVGLSGVTAIASGAFHSLALKNDGTVWAWGENSNGVLGDGTRTSSSTPVQVSGLTGVTTIAAGWTHTVALKSDGTVWAWGGNSSGELGNGTFTGSLTPVQVSGLTGATAIAAGLTHTLALKNDGTVWAWGNNTWYQLGFIGLPMNTPVQVSGLTGIAAIAAGSIHSIALKTDGTIWTWGGNNYGELGDGTTTNKPAPAQVSGFTGVTVPQCLDGIDNDGDGLIDLADPGCSSAQDNSELNVSFGGF